MNLLYFILKGDVVFMEISRAKKSDIDKVEMIYNSIHDGEEAGFFKIGWIRNVYPTGKTAEDALKRGDLFVMRDNGKIVASAVINQIQVEEYKYAEWKHSAKDSEVMVLHTLVVDPSASGRGYGRAFVNFYEEYARQNNCRELRIDTNAINKRAREMYKRLGYEEIGVLKCNFNGISDINLVCLEKSTERF